MVRCYHCGREIEDEDRIVMKDINVGFLELSHERHPFHAECWKERQHRERMRTLKILLALGIPCLLFIFLYAILPFLL